MSKNKLNRREFLEAASAATVGFTALRNVAAPTEVQAFRSPAGSVIPFSREELVEPRTQRTLSGQQLSEVAFPLGGIGTGTISLGGRGELRDWEIFNRPAKGRMLPFTFAALWVKPEGGSPLLRVVEGPIETPYTGWNGYSRESGQGLRHFDRATLVGKYPIATFEFEDSALPVSVSLEAFNPFIPLNVDDSSLPVAIFKYHVTNRSSKVADIALSFSTMNPVGYDGKAFLDSNEHPGFGKNVNTVRRENAGGVDLTGVDLTSGKYDV